MHVQNGARHGRHGSELGRWKIVGPRVDCALRWPGRLPLSKPVRSQLTRRTLPTTISPDIALGTFTEIATVGLLDHDVNEGRPPIAWANAKVAALSIHISGVWTMNR